MSYITNNSANAVYTSIDEAIVLANDLTPDMSLLMMRLPMLEVSSIVSCISSVQSDAILESAQSIIDNRSTPWGIRDYVYCLTTLSFTNSVAHDEAPLSVSGEELLSNICIQCALDSRGTLVDRMQKYLYLFFYHKLLTAAEGDKVLSWRYFSKGQWRKRDKQLIKSMISNRLMSCNVGSILGANDDQSSKAIREILRNLDTDALADKLFVSGFAGISNDKNGVFVMPDWVFVNNGKIIRKGLPSDKSTICGNLNPDMDKWVDKRYAMLDTFKQWMSTSKVVDNYLDLLSLALFLFDPRYAIINKGSGSDGKTTLLLIIAALFGGHAIVFSSAGSDVDSGDANGPTPAVNAMIGKRIGLIGEVKNLSKLVNSQGFKASTGGDRFSFRKLFNEFDESTVTLKMLQIGNTNQQDLTLTRPAEMTRVRVVEFLHKTMTKDDMLIINSSQIINATRGVYGYDSVFIKEYGECLMAELIYRNTILSQRNNEIDLCAHILDSTRHTIVPKTIRAFLAACTFNMQDLLDMQASSDPADANTLQIVRNNMNTNSECSIRDLYAVYGGWKKNLGGKISRSDPKDMSEFMEHLNTVCKIETHDVHGVGEYFVRDVVIKPQWSLHSFSIAGFSQMRDPSSVSNLYRTLSSSTGDPDVTAGTSNIIYTNVPGYISDMQ